MRYSTVLIGALALSMQACVNAPRNATESVSVPAEYGRGDSAKNVPAQALSDGRTSAAKGAETEIWWQQFGDDRLSRLVTRVLESNTDLASASLRLQQARLIAGLALDALLPHADASASVGFSKPLEGSDTVSSRSSSANFGIGYELDLWRKLRGQRDIARWEAEATAEDLQSTALVLISDTCNLFWMLGFLNHRIAAGNDSLARLRQTQKLVQSQFDAGAISRLELREAEQSLQSQLAAQSQLIQQRVETRNALTVLLDGHPWAEADEPSDLRNVAIPKVREGLPAELLSRRPDLRAAELRLRGTLAGVDVTRVSYYPAVNLTGSVSSGGLSLREVLSDPVGTLGAGVVLPFLRFNEMRLDIAVARKDYEIAANEFRNTLYEAFTEIDNALSAEAELAIQLTASQKSYDEAVEIERLYGVRYRAGATSLRIWLDAQESRRAEELSLAQTKLSQLRNSSVLFRALGGAG